MNYLAIYIVFDRVSEEQITFQYMDLMHAKPYYLLDKVFAIKWSKII